MRIIALKNLAAFWERHPETRPSLQHWVRVAKRAEWTSMQDIQTAFPKAKVLNSERVRFEIHGGDFRLIAAFDFRFQVVFVKFLGTHAEYDRIDALTIARY